MIEQKLALADDGYEYPEPMPLIDVKVPRLLAAVWRDWRQYKYHTEDVAGAALLMFMSASPAERQRFIDSMHDWIGKAFDELPFNEGFGLCGNSGECDAFSMLRDRMVVESRESGET